MRLAQTCWSVKPLGSFKIKHLYGVRLWLHALDCGQCSCDSGMFAVQPSRKLILSQRLCIVECATLCEAAYFLCSEGQQSGNTSVDAEACTFKYVTQCGQSDTGAARGAGCTDRPWCWRLFSAPPLCPNPACQISILSPSHAPPPRPCSHAAH